jgi:hypothetical protein
MLGRLLSNDGGAVDREEELLTELGRCTPTVSFCDDERQASSILKDDMADMIVDDALLVDPGILRPATSAMLALVPTFPGSGGASTVVADGEERKVVALRDETGSLRSCTEAPDFVEELRAANTSSESVLPLAIRSV